MLPQIRAALERYVDLLFEANAKFNLTAIQDRGVAWETLIVESLDLLPFLESVPAGARVVDIGSGGGVPALPLAIARPDLRFTLIDGTGKKARFLEETAAALGLENVRVLNGRSEDFAHERRVRESFDVATARAVGEVRELVELTLPLLKVGGFLLAPKGQKGEAEALAATNASSLVGGGMPEVLRVERPSEKSLVVVRVTKVEKTHTSYPRPPGKPKSDPL
ncbi:MAG: 16S rRNA (guanine(527)-N(7))-methyltransferase RsmG [Planctomycetes bacterium]|nr:16S rRNA (guanine(527)-N(7))-methyltransferase RsmG [Planctomycetota bacterium]MCC7168959.1 16S rRNA (guanine(527)-N(7))-methyltransferase RsmG [Planctomycetota bacterium]